MNRSPAFVDDVPPGVVMVTSTVPAESGGELALHELVDEQMTVPVARPKLTAVAPATKPLPVMLTAVPPTRGPALGLTAVTVGATS